MDHRFDAGVRHNEAVFVKPLTDVDRDDDGAKPGASEDDFREFDPIAEHQADPVSSLDAGARQVGSDPRNVVLEIRISYARWSSMKAVFSGKASAAAASSE